MELTQPRASAATASSLGTETLHAPVLVRIAPLWRHGVWLATLFVVLVAAAAIRLDVQQTRADLARNARAVREARILNDRLRLEVDARRRVVAMEAVAARLQMSSVARVVRVGGDTP